MQESAEREKELFHLLGRLAQILVYTFDEWELALSFIDNCIQF